MGLAEFMTEDLVGSWSPAEMIGVGIIAYIGYRVIRSGLEKVFNTTKLGSMQMNTRNSMENLLTPGTKTNSAIASPKGNNALAA